MGAGIDGVDEGSGWGSGRLGGGRGCKGVGDGSGGDADEEGSDHGVGDAGKGGSKGDRRNGVAGTRLLPAEVLSALVRLGTTTAWAC